MAHGYWIVTRFPHAQLSIMLKLSEKEARQKPRKYAKNAVRKDHKAL